MVDMVVQHGEGCLAGRGVLICVVDVSIIRFREIILIGCTDFGYDIS
jgi:hypothetical protein